MCVCARCKRVIFLSNHTDSFVLLWKSYLFSIAKDPCIHMDSPRKRYKQTKQEYFRFFLATNHNAPPHTVHVWHTTKTGNNFVLLRTMYACRICCSPDTFVRNSIDSVTTIRARINCTQREKSFDVPVCLKTEAKDAYRLHWTCPLNTMMRLLKKVTAISLFCRLFVRMSNTAAHIRYHCWIWNFIHFKGYPMWCLFFAFNVDTFICSFSFALIKFQQKSINVSNSIHTKMKRNTWMYSRIQQQPH